jgi:flagellar hook protein FlgE
MMRSFSAAVSGLRTHQTYLDMVANDIANVNTLAYKSNRFNFKDAFNQTLRDAGGAGTNLGSVNAQQVGLGVEVGSIDNQMGQGPIQSTGNPFDLAIQGDGFFRLSDQADLSNATYTRAGNFSLDESGTLVNQDGYFVVGYPVATLPATGADTATSIKLVIPTTARSASVSQDGLVSYIDAAGVETNVGYVSMSKFNNSAGLERISANRWAQTQASGTAANSTATSNGLGSISSRSLEMSNVDLAFEFAEMIKAQRGYQVNARTITTADEMLLALTQMKR